MKKILFFGIILNVFISSGILAQANPNSKYNYAEITIHLGGFNKYKSTAISFGADYTIQVDKKEEITIKVNSFKNGVDIKNYMGDMGWEYVDQQNLLFNDMIVTYTFRKAK